MANYLTTDTDLTAVADAIRTKGGTSAALSFPTGFVDAIQAISGGSGLKYDMGRVTLEEDVVISNIATYSIPHNLGEVPKCVIVWPSLIDGNGTYRGYIFLDKICGEQQYLSSSARSSYPLFAWFYVTEVGPPVVSRVPNIPTSASYVIGASSLPTATDIKLFRYQSTSTFYAGSLDYFVSEGWW